MLSTRLQNTHQLLLEHILRRENSAATDLKNDAACTGLQNVQETRRALILRPAALPAIAAKL